MPAGSGRESGDWTTSGDAATGRCRAPGPTLTEGRSGSANAGDINHEYGLPEDTIVVTRPWSGAEPSLEKSMSNRSHFIFDAAAGACPGEALEQFATYDFQRDKAANTYFDEYVPAANYAIGVYRPGPATPSRNHMQWLTARMHRRSRDADGRIRGPEAYQHVICRTPEPHVANENPRVHKADERLFQKDRAARPLRRVALHALQFRARSQDVSQQPAMVAGITDKLWSVADIVAMIDTAEKSN